MRPITHRVTVAILVVVGLLLALGALPTYLKSGDPYYLTATQVETDRPAVNVTRFPTNRFSYTTEAIDGTTADAPGRSSPYWRGPVGFKESFSHSPFDELDALRARNASAADERGVYVRRNGTVYRLTVTQNP